jgi:hypothetical protein
MKKTAMIAAVLAAMAFTAQAADVYSSNIVGYTKLTVPAGLSLSGGQFQTVGGEELDISAIVPEAGFVEGDALRFWNGSGYQTIAYFNTLYDPDTWATLGPGWGDNNQYPADRLIDLGEGFWVQCFNGGTLTISGEVGTNTVVTAPAGLSLVVNTSPAAFDIADLQVTGFVEGDALRFWNGSGYQTIAYFNTLYDPDTWANLGPGFGDNNQYPAEKTVGVGEGFWAQCFNGGTITFPDPTPAP